MKIVKIIGEVN